MNTSSVRFYLKNRLTGNLVDFRVTENRKIGGLDDLNLKMLEFVGTHKLKVFLFLTFESNYFGLLKC